MSSTSDDPTNVPERTETPERPPAISGRRWTPILLCVACLTAYGPLLYAYGGSLWELPHYQLFPFLLLGSGLLVHQRLKNAGTLAPGSGKLYAVPLAGALGLLACATLLGSPWLAAVSLIVMSAALIIALGGKLLMVRLFPAWAYLWLVIRPPFDLDRQLVTWLQFQASALAGRVLDAMSVLHVRSGNVIKVGSETYFVEEACSGINSLITILAAVLLYVLWYRRSTFRTVVLLCAGFVWLMFFNVVRVVGVVVLASDHGISVLEGWRHEAYGAALFCCTVLAVGSTECLIQALTPPWFVVRGAVADIGPLVVPAPRRTQLARVAPVVLLIVLAAAQFPLLSIGTRAPGLAETVALPDLGEEALPATIADWRRSGYETQTRGAGSIYGRRSQQWRYDTPLQMVVVSLDYPFDRHHDLALCYRGWGWNVHEETRHPLSIEGLGDGAITEMRMTRERAGMHGLVAYLHFNVAGELVTDELFRRTYGFRNRLETLGMVLRGDPAPSLESRSTVIQLQVFVVGYGPIDDATGNRTRELLVRFLDALRPTLFKSLEGGS